MGHLIFGVRIYRKEVVFEGVEWICVAQDMIVGWGVGVKGWAVVHTVMNLRVA